MTIVYCCRTNGFGSHVQESCLRAKDRYLSSDSRKRLLHLYQLATAAIPREGNEESETYINIVSQYLRHLW